MKSQHKRRVAFSLVELLAVIAIIVVLAALLLPSIKSARDRAKTAKCANNEREMGAAFAGYLSDNNGRYPYISVERPLPAVWPGPNGIGIKCVNGQPWRWYGGMSGPHWFDALTNYMGGNPGTVFSCPANPWSPGVSYKMNMSTFPGNWRDSMSSLDHRCCAPNSTIGWADRQRLSNITRPAEGMIVGECPTSKAGEDPWSKVSGTALPYVVANTGQYALQPLYVTNLFAYAGTGMPFDWVIPDCNAYASAFHSHGVNNLYVDGHVSWISKNTLISYCAQSVTADTPGAYYWFSGGTGTGGQFPAEGLPYDGPMVPCAPDWDP